MWRTKKSKEDNAATTCKDVVAKAEEEEWKPTSIKQYSSKFKLGWGKNNKEEEPDDKESERAAAVDVVTETSEAKPAENSDAEATTSKDDGPTLKDELVRILEESSAKAKGASSNRGQLWNRALSGAIKGITKLNDEMNENKEVNDDDSNDSGSKKDKVMKSIVEAGESVTTTKKDQSKAGEVAETSSKASHWKSLWDKKSLWSEMKDDYSVSEMPPAMAYQEKDVEVEISTQTATLHIHNAADSSQAVPLSYAPSKDRPSLYDEALEMLTASLLIYIFADLRVMARDGTISHPGLLEDSISVHTVVEAIQQNKKLLSERAIEHEDELKALKDIHAHQSKSQDDPNAPTHIQQMLQGGAVASAAGLAQSKESSLVKFRDEKTTRGVVYGIAVNHLRKRITVIFRGSVTQQDFITDAKSHLKKIDNPIIRLEPEHENSTIKIHTGFHQYLFRKDEDGKERLQHILDDVKELLAKHPTYRLYCTGHSLGGACCTLFGFFAAMDDEIVKNGPVVVISVASPRVGGYKFTDAFHVLEKHKRVQHLRISNKEDVVTHLPFIALKATAMSPLMSAIRGAGNIYKHCGINVELSSIAELSHEERQDDGDTTSERLTNTKHYQISHPKGTFLTGARPSFYSQELLSALEAARNLAESLVPVGNADFKQVTGYHSCQEYEARLIAAEEYFSTITLDQLYQESEGGKSLVGSSA